jgi:diamine N-acetyltransferase
VLKSNDIYLRKIVSSDAAYLLLWENNQEHWEVSETKTPFTLKQIEQFVESEHDLKKNLQLRFMVCLNENDHPIGCIDLFEYDVDKAIAGIGILIAERAERNKGYAYQALNLLIDYSRNELNIVHLFCNIHPENQKSIRLFENAGFNFVKEAELDGREVNYYLKEC